jgi:glycosyltransferase involved in cell wall biosynthesis
MITKYTLSSPLLQVMKRGYNYTRPHKLMEPTQKKKVLYLITKSNWGGAQKYVYDLATNLPKDSYEAVVALGGEGELFTKLIAAGIKTLSIENLGRDIRISDDIGAFFKIIKVIKQEKPDILHINSSKAGFFGSIAGRLLFVPLVIFTAHGWAFNETRSESSKSILKTLQWVTVMLCHRTICVSNKLVKDISKLPLASARVACIYNGIKTPVFLEKNEARSALIAKAPALKGVEKDIWIGTIAELHPNKGYDVYAEAVSILAGTDYFNTRPVRFVWIGEGEMRVDLESFISTKKLSDRIALTGHIPDAATLMNAFDYFILPSRTEALGYVLIEAGLAKVPVIATAVGGIPEVIDDLKTGILIQSENPGEIAKAIGFTLDRPEDAKKMALNLYEKVTSTFSLGKMLSETEVFYTKN